MVAFVISIIFDRGFHQNAGLISSFYVFVERPTDGRETIKSYLKVYIVKGKI